jgi:hypothetical protein
LGVSPPGRATQGRSWRTGGKHLLETVQMARSRFHFTHSRPLRFTGPLFFARSSAQALSATLLALSAAGELSPQAKRATAKQRSPTANSATRVSPPASLRLRLCGPSCSGRALARLRLRHHPAEARWVSADAAADHGFSLLPAPRLSAEATFCLEAAILHTSSTPHIHIVNIYDCTARWLCTESSKQCLYTHCNAQNQMLTSARWMKPVLVLACAETLVLSTCPPHTAAPGVAVVLQLSLPSSSPTQEASELRRLS